MTLFFSERITPSLFPELDYSSLEINNGDTPAPHLYNLKDETDIKKDCGSSRRLGDGIILPVKRNNFIESLILCNQ